MQTSHQIVRQVGEICILKMLQRRTLIMHFFVVEWACIMCTDCVGTVNSIYVVIYQFVEIVRCYQFLEAVCHLTL
uniref:Uncharacterized protein n=1 Tax=Anguilla anguilla TaxID=7936 RepID=A0A0E9PZV4_ANGAN